VLRARGSPRRLFVLVYAVGTVVTVFMSNDATAVVLTPAVFAAAKAARREPLAYVYICAFIANAASFVLPISNPANLVLFDGELPGLIAWLARFALPSLVAVLVTYAVLRWRLRRHLQAAMADAPQRRPLPRGAGVTLVGIVLTALVLLGASFARIDLGWPAAAAGIATALAAMLVERSPPWPVLRHVSWSIIPLVAGLFVLVAAVEQTGAIGALVREIAALAEQSASGAAFVFGTGWGFASNLMNNLPAGLIAATALGQAKPPEVVVDAVLIGVDLGPNLSITGSLATILWLIALRRDGELVGFWDFFKIGVVTMPPALILAIAVRTLV
jgi:arsenical pump membrane protein